MKRISFSVLLLVASAGIALAQTSRPASRPASAPTTAPVVVNPTIPVEFVEHKSSDGGVTLRAPAEWRERKSNSANGKLNLIVDAKGNSVNLVIVPAMPGQTVEQTLVHVPPGLKAHMPGFQRLISAEAITLARTPAARLVYDAQVGPKVELRFCQFFVIRNDKQYILTYTAYPEDYERLLPSAEQVAASMKVP